MKAETNYLLHDVMSDPTTASVLDKGSGVQFLNDTLFVEYLEVKQQIIERNARFWIL